MNKQQTQTPAAEHYNAEDIQVLKGLDAVRMRPGMYIGTTGSKGLHHLLWEIVDNAVDEAANGFADRIEITLHGDNSVTVKDNGRGIPVDVHPELGISGVEVVFTQLHAGGKFNNSNYAFSGGLHGVGASVTNALSEWLTVRVDKDGKSYEQHFHSPQDPKDSTKILSGVPIDSLHEVGATKEHGSTITFLADSRVFKNVKMDYRVVSERVRELAFLNKGITFVLTDERTDDEDGNVTREQFCYEGGLKDFVLYLNENKAPLHLSPLYWSGGNDTLQLEFAFQYTSNYTENFISYVNNIPTSEGGMHETGVKTAMTKAFNDYARSRNFLKAKEDNLLGEDFREGITLVMSVKMANVQFEGQTKTKLGNVEARIACEALATDAFSKLLESNAKTAEVIIKEKATAWAIVSLSHKVIDKVNILQASLEAMRRAYLKVAEQVKVDTLMVDGNKKPDVPVRTIAVVKGDSKIPEIMAASILAKTERDRIMMLCDRKWPAYGYSKHKGYPTKEHRKAIAEYGPSPIERLSFHVKEEELTPDLF